MMEEEDLDLLKGKVSLDFLETYLPIWDPVKEFSTNVLPYDENEGGGGPILLPWTHPPVRYLQVVVTFQNPKKPKLRVVIKTPSAPHATATRQRKYFHKETFFYDELNPQLNRLMDNCKLAVPPFVAASISDVSDEPLETFLALRDVSIAKFIAPKTTPLDFQHSSLVMKELAKLHALSWLYRKSKAVLSLQVLHPIIKETTLTAENLSTVNNNVLKMTLELPEIQSSMNEDVVEGLNNLLNSSELSVGDLIVKFISSEGYSWKDIPSTTSSTTQDEDIEDCPWAMICHGDLSTSNMLFRYNPTVEEEPQDVFLMNWGSIRESCPTTDLSMFLSTCEFPPMKEKELLRLYYDSFLSICTQGKKGCPQGFNLEALYNRVQRAQLMAKLIGLLQRQIPVTLNNCSMNKTENGQSWSNNVNNDSKTLNFKQLIS